MFRRVLTVLPLFILCLAFSAVLAQDRSGSKLERSQKAKLQERSGIYDMQLATADKYKSSVAATTAAKHKENIPKAVPVANTLREEMTNSFVVGGGYLYQRVDGLPVDRVQGVALGGFYYPVSWIGVGGEYQYGRGTKNSTAGTLSRQDRLTRHVGILGPELSGYPGD